MKVSKSLCGKFAVIRYYNGAHPDTSIPAPASLVKFDERDPGKFYWSGGRSWCVIGETTELVEVYGKIKEGFQFERLYLKFMKKYYPVTPSEYCQSDGWLSPDGKFYTCNNGGHDFLAERIAASVYRKLEYWTWLKGYAGWAMVYKDGLVVYDQDSMKPEMLSALSAMSKVGDGNWRKRISNASEKYNPHSLEEL